MDFSLNRTRRASSGIFGQLISRNGIIFASLEHAYCAGQDWVAKVPPGEYTCKRGLHHLHSGPIETFEVLEVPDHTGILIHPGNLESASEGCILIGTGVVGQGLTESRKAFDRFIAIQDGIDRFILYVR